MGCGSSVGRVNVTDHLKESGDFVIEFISLNDVPKADIGSESDPFIKAYLSILVSNQLQRVGEMFKSCRRNDNKNPVLHCYHNFNLKPKKEFYLRIEVYDYDSKHFSNFLGDVNIPVEKLEENEDVLTFNLNLRSYGSQKLNPNFNIKLRRVFLKRKPPIKKTFFIVRHGESKWNHAQSNSNVAGLIHFDHGLTLRGVLQAQKLQKKWQHGNFSITSRLTYDCSLINFTYRAERKLRC